MRLSTPQPSNKIDSRKNDCHRNTCGEGTPWTRLIGIPCSLFCLVIFLLPSAALGTCRTRCNKGCDSDLNSRAQIIRHLANVWVSHLNQHACTSGPNQEQTTPSSSDNTNLQKELSNRNNCHSGHHTKFKPRSFPFYLSFLTITTDRTSGSLQERKFAIPATLSSSYARAGKLGRKEILAVAPKHGPPNSN